MRYGSTKKVLAALEREGVEYKVFGAVALSLHGLARATQALDLFVAPTEENIGKLRRALFAVFEDPDIDELTAEDLLGDYPAVQYIPPENNFHIDILTRLGEVYDYDGLESEQVDLDGVQVTVVTPRMLYEMKKSTVRPEDWGDAERLKKNFDLEE
ncbi:MAG: hypothetical protein MI919_35470 [Holophagales bacterium]|nr:hypothetical protein [Holophagales bacterium]